MVVEKEVGASGANDMSTRPGQSEVTSSNSAALATLPVIQVVNTFPRPVVAHDAGALVSSPRNRMCDQLNHTNSFVYG